jgi:prepilin-type N-terminal cleavage/methylation domain-containing protein
MELHFLTRKNVPHKKFGFTLLELLIVIAIIGILVSAGVASYSQAQKKSRDSRRKSDLKAIQSAFEQYYAESPTQSYPVGCSVDATFLPGGIPKDPKTGDAYNDNGAYGSGTCTAAGYCFCVTLESGVGNSNGSCSYTAGTSHFCVSQLQ